MIQSEKVSLWIGNDQIHCKPRIHFYFIFLFNPKSQILNTPKDHVLFSLICSLLIEKINKSSGHEASLAGLEYSVGEFSDGAGIKLKLKGYSGDKIMLFSQLFID